MNRLEEIEKRLKAATPGPWRIGHVSQLRDDIESADIDGPEGQEIAHVFPRGDQSFIASAPNDIACLLELVKNYELALNEIKAGTVVFDNTSKTVIACHVTADQALTQGRKIKGE